MSFPETEAFANMAPGANEEDSGVTRAKTRPIDASVTEDEDEIKLHLDNTSAKSAGEFQAQASMYILKYSFS